MVNRSEIRYRITSTLLQADTPLTLDELVAGCGIEQAALVPVLTELIAKGQVVQGDLDPAKKAPQYGWGARWEQEAQRRTTGVQQEVHAALDQAGARYDPDADQWTACGTGNAPSGRELPVSVWTGSKMIVWGGSDSSGRLATGGVYDPTLDLWWPVSVSGNPTARSYTDAVWTGSEMIVWGGSDGTTYMSTGGRYSP